MCLAPQPLVSQNIAIVMKNLLNFGCLLLLLTNAFMIKHVLKELPMDPSMMWHFHQINQGWHKVVGESLE